MTLLPIVVRELRVAARRKKHLSARFGSAFAAVLAVPCCWSILNQIQFGPGIVRLFFKDWLSSAFTIASLCQPTPPIASARKNGKGRWAFCF